MVSKLNLEFVLELGGLILGLLSTLIYLIVSFLWWCFLLPSTLSLNILYYAGILISISFFGFGLAQALSGRFRVFETDSQWDFYRKYQAFRSLFLGGWVISLWIPVLQYLTWAPRTCVTLGIALCFLVPVLTVWAWEQTHLVKSKVKM